MTSFHENSLKSTLKLLVLGVEADSGHRVLMHCQPPDIYTFLLLPGAAWSSDAVGSAAQPVLRDEYRIQWRMASPVGLCWVPVDGEKGLCRRSEQVVATVLLCPGVAGCSRLGPARSSGSTAQESGTVPCSATWAWSPQPLCPREGLHTR